MSANPNNILELAKPYETQWPEPDKSVLTGYQAQAPILPLSIFGSMAKWLEQAAEAKSSPVDYVFGSLLAATSGLIGNALAVSPWSGWTEPPTLWVGLVGRPSSGKSPAIDSVLDPVHTLESELSGNFETEWQNYELEAERAKASREMWEKDLREALKKNQAQPPKPENAYEPELPVRPRMLVSDCTIEALTGILAGNPRGLVAARDELAGWLEGMGRYSSGGFERSFWIEAFGARPFVVDRVKNAGTPLRIPRLSISVLGGIQPDRLEDCLLSGSDDGLSGRFLYIWPDAVPPKRPTCAYDKVFIERVFRRLRSLKQDTNEYGEPTPRVMKLEEAAAEKFQSFRLELAQAEESAHGILLSHIGKLPGITLRIALVLEMLWWAVSEDSNPPVTVSEKALIGACGLVDGYLLPMAKRTFGAASLPESEKQATALAKWIYANRPEMVNASTIRRYRYAGLKTAEDVSNAINGLEEAGWLSPKPSRQGGNTGRQKQDYLVNPKLWELNA